MKAGVIRILIGLGERDAPVADGDEREPVPRGAPQVACDGLTGRHGSNRTYADEQALVEESVRSYRTLPGKVIRSTCRTRWITPWD